MTKNTDLDHGFDRPTGLISYVHGRYSQLTAACRAFEQQQVPMLRQPGDAAEDVTPEAVLAYHSVIASTAMHPDFIRWSLQRGNIAIGELRLLIGMDGVPDLALIETLIQRDGAVCTGALELFEKYPDHVRDAVLAVAPLRSDTAIALDVSRTLLSLPGPFLFAWQGDWHLAASLIKQTFGDLDVADCSEMDSVRDRLSDVEDDVSTIRNQMLAASAVLKPLPREAAGAPETAGEGPLT